MHQIYKLNICLTKIFKIMKTLARFQHNCCTIKFQMQTTKECVANPSNKLYKVVVSPKHKNTWSEYEKEFAYSKEAQNYMLEQIKFWIC